MDSTHASRRWQRPQDKPLPLFDCPPANRSKPSQEAAAAIADHAPTQLAQILEFLRRRGSMGATAHEVCVALDLLMSTASARLNQLTKAGLARDSGQRRSTGRGVRPRMVTVWTATHGGSKCNSSAD